MEGADRVQSTLLPECLEDWIDEENPVGAVDAFVDAPDLKELKLYIYGYLNRVQSRRRLELEAGRNFEVLWLLGRLVPDRKMIADFRKDNGPALRKVCARFVDLCRETGLLSTASVAIDGSKVKAVNNLDENFTKGKVERRRDCCHRFDSIRATTSRSTWRNPAINAVSRRRSDDPTIRRSDDPTIRRSRSTRRSRPLNSGPDFATLPLPIT